MSNIGCWTTKVSNALACWLSAPARAVFAFPALGKTGGAEVAGAEGEEGIEGAEGEEGIEGREGAEVT